MDLIRNTCPIHNEELKLDCGVQICWSCENIQCQKDKEIYYTGFKTKIVCHGQRRNLIGKESFVTPKRNFNIEYLHASIEFTINDNLSANLNNNIIKHNYWDDTHFYRDYKNKTPELVNLPLIIKCLTKLSYFSGSYQEIVDMSI